MTLLIDRCLKHIEHALGGSASPDIQPLEVLNTAGLWFTAAHEWKYLERNSALVGFTASQSYATLPTDFREIIKVAFTSGLTARFMLTTTGTIADYRTGQQNFGIAITYGAVTFRAAGASGGAPTPVLELYPTPTATDASALTLFYRAGWVLPTTSEEQGAINIPTYCEPIFLEALRAVALGYEKDEMQERLARVQAGPMWAAAISQDGLVQPEFGKMRGGAVQIGIGGPSVFASPYTIANP